MPPLHLRATAELAERVLLPGDPGRALLLAQEVLEAPRMFNHHRGLWGYTGESIGGGLLTIQSTGMGGPSAAIVGEELIALGARTLLRVGTCAAVDPTLGLGELLVVEAVLAEDGTSRALGAEGWVRAALAAETGSHVPARPVQAVSTDLFYARGDDDEAAALARWRQERAAVVEMECATLFQLGALRGVEAGALLVVSDLLEGGRERIGEEALEEAARHMGRAALSLLGSAGAGGTGSIPELG